MTPNLEIVAEAAQGFEGDPRLARLLVIAAGAAGADAIKFQLVYADELATPDYQYFPLFKSLEMEDAVWVGLAEQARSLGVRLDLDVFGPRSLALAERVGAAIKLHATDITNYGFLDQVAQSGVDRVVLGAGGARRDEIDAALERLSGKTVVLMLGFQAYPTATEDNQIARVASLSRAYEGNPDVVVGFGDHALPETGLATALSALAYGAGARVLEKHLTLGRNMKLEDHESALNPDEFETYVRHLRETAAAYGATGSDADFGMSEAEARYRKTIRRHVIATRDIAAGEVVDAAAVTLKRSAHAAPLTDPLAVVGRTAATAIAAGQALGAADLK
jgi:N,N'-diacetyllegionaminate synthase